MPAKKYYVRKKIEAEFFSALDTLPLEKIEDAQELLLPLIQKYGKEAVEDFWNAKIVNRRMGGIGRGRRRSEVQKAAIAQDRLARKKTQAGKSERQKRNHRLIVLGAKMEEAARSAGLAPEQIASMTEKDWDEFFFQRFKTRLRKCFAEVKFLIKNKDAIKKEEGAE